MKLLLDTQAILLAAQDRLPRSTRELLLNPSNELYFSLVSFWEMGIKAARGTLRLNLQLTELCALVQTELGAEEELLTVEAVQKATSLPFHHKDPFDRLLAGQAMTSGHSLVSGDAIFEKYGCNRTW